MSSTRSTPLLFVLAFLLLLAGRAHATFYGNFTDPTGTVQYLNVQDVNGLFGAPAVSLNSLDFTPLNFQAQCSTSPASPSCSATTTDLLTLDIQAIAGQRIDSLQVTEGLDYSLLSFDANGFAAATVSANIFIDIVEVNGVPVNGINANFSVLYSPSNNVIVEQVNLANGTLLGTTGAIDIQQIVANAGGNGEATRIRISLDNTLRALVSGQFGQSTIRKRDADFVSLTVNGGNPIPEPTTAVLTMGGLALLANRRRRS